jgi:predicted metalloprotease with PDZ domain
MGHNNRLWMISMVCFYIVFHIPFSHNYLYAQFSEKELLYKSLAQQAQAKTEFWIDTKNDTIFSNRHTAAQIAYKICPLFIDNHIVLRIDVTFQTECDSSTIFGFFPQSSWNQHSYLVRSIQTNMSSVIIEALDNTLYWKIGHKPFSSIYLHYFVIQDSITLEQQSITQPFPAIFGTNYFFLENASLFLLPVQWLTTKKEFHTKRYIELHWQMDSTWHCANSFGIATPSQFLSVSASNIVRSMTIGYRNSDQCTISSWKIRQNQSILVATVSYFSKKNFSFGLFVRDIAAAYVRFWKDKKPFHFLATLVPVTLPPQDEDNGVIGFAVANAFVGFLSDKRNSINFSCKYLMAHEMLHKWIDGERFPTQDYSGFGYCAVEGFTDYLARYIMLQNKIISQAEYVHDINLVLDNYHHSAQRNVIADTVKKYFWQNQEIMKIPYRRGDILAHCWDAEIRRNTKGKYDFANALRVILSKYRMVTDQVFVKALVPFIGRNVMNDILKYMKYGETIPIPADMLPFAQLTTMKDCATIPQFKLLN